MTQRHIKKLKLQSRRSKHNRIGLVTIKRRKHHLKNMKNKTKIGLKLKHGYNRKFVTRKNFGGGGLLRWFKDFRAYHTPSHAAFKPLPELKNQSRVSGQIQPEAQVNPVEAPIAASAIGAIAAPLHPESGEYKDDNPTLLPPPPRPSQVNLNTTYFRNRTTLTPRPTVSSSPSPAPPAPKPRPTVSSSPPPPPTVSSSAPPSTLWEEPVQRNPNYKYDYSMNRKATEIENVFVTGGREPPFNVRHVETDLQEFLDKAKALDHRDTVVKSTQHNKFDIIFLGNQDYSGRADRYAFGGNADIWLQKITYTNNDPDDIDYVVRINKTGGMTAEQHNFWPIWHVPAALANINKLSLIRAFHRMGIQGISKADIDSIEAAEKIVETTQQTLQDAKNANVEANTKLRELISEKLKGMTSEKLKGITPG